MANTISRPNMYGIILFMDYNIILNDKQKNFFAQFVDREYGEWYGYLDRQGEPTSTAKGAPFKGQHYAIHVT